MTREAPLESASCLAANSYSAKSATLPRGSSGGKRGQPRGSTQQQANDPRKRPLYQALLKIGSNEKSLKPAALRKYKPLLDSPEVRRRGGSTTDPEALAQHANAALLNIVDGIAAPTRRLVAQAALCTETQYEGLSVGQRVTELEAAGISEDMFKYHRGKVFDVIVAVLESDASPDPPMTRAVRNLSPRDKTPRVDPPQVLARIAASLQYAMLTSIFVAQFDPQLDQEPIPPLRRDESWNAYARRAFESFSEFTFAYGLYLESDVVAKKDLASHLPSDARESLLFLLRTIRDCGPPIAPADRQWFEWHHFKGLETDRLYQDVWNPWFYEAPLPRLGKLPSIPRLEPIAAKAGAAAFTIGKYVSLEEPVFSDARRMAHKTLAYSYNFDELAPIIAGRSLRHYADTYFDRASTTLANSDLVWYGSD
jgi:hypothetical protein